MRTLLPLLIIATLLSACGEDDMLTRRAALTEVCGVDKYQGPQGVDVSTYQPNYDWVAQAAAGIRYGYARVSNGTGIIDDQFDRNWREMRANGIYRGVYQYFRPGQDAAAQANLVVERVGRLGPGDMPPMIDVETNDDQPPSVVAQKVREWIDIVEAGTGKKPTIYTGAYFWQDNVGDTSFGEYPLWIANYGADCPLIPDGWTDWTFWQYCDGNTQYCTNGMGFDRDVFNGTDEELDAIANGGTWAAEVVEVSPAQTIEVGSPAAAWVEVRNSGSSSWNADTRLGTTEPRDRDSPLVTDAWEAPNRAAAVVGEVAPGETYRFELELSTQQVGRYAETFGLVQEGVTWFADAGGPPDRAISIEIEVTSEPDEMQDPDDPVPDEMDDDDPDIPPTPGETNGGALPPTVGASPGVEGGCNTVPIATHPLLLAALLLVRRR